MTKRVPIIPTIVVIAAAAIHSSTLRFAHEGTGTVRMCFPFPTRSAITQ